MIKEADPAIKAGDGGDEIFRRAVDDCEVFERLALAKKVFDVGERSIVIAHRRE